jgi:hypothetical protein
VAIFYETDFFRCGSRFIPANPVSIPSGGGISPQ